jgi:hypothetical protein
LREKNAPGVGSDRHGLSLGEELGLEVGEVLEDEGGEVAILSESEQVLLVQRVEDSLLGVRSGMSYLSVEEMKKDRTHVRVLIDDQGADEERLALVGCAKAVHGEAVGERVSDCPPALSQARTTHQPGKQVTEPNMLSNALAM